MKKPKIDITNQQAVDLYKNYQNINSTNIREFIPIAPSTSTKCIKYAMQWGEEQELFYKDTFKERYMSVPVEVFLQAFNIDIKRRLRAVNGKA